MRADTPDKDRVRDLVGGYDRVALVLQGRGALGAYQAGLYHALSEAECEPNWLSGVSIGAINASIIAGNKPEDRLVRLKDFWDLVSGRKIWAFTPRTMSSLVRRCASIGKRGTTTHAAR